MAPAGGEHLRAGAFFGGEKGDDVDEDVVGEAADTVPEALLLQPPLLGSRDHPHGGARCDGDRQFAASSAATAMVTNTQAGQTYI